MKNFGSVKFLCVLLSVICALGMFAGCTDEEESDVQGLVAVYTGENIYDTYHEFTKDEFYVYVTFTDGTDGMVNDFDFEYIGLDEGYYHLVFTYHGVSNDSYVKCDVPVYPSDMQ